MMRSLLFLLTAISISFSASAQLRYYDDLFTEVTVTSDILFGTGLNANNEAVNLGLDVYEPTGDSKTDRIAIIVAHGGSFLPDQGSKTDPYIVDYANAMAMKGYVVFAISYRLGWSVGAAQEQNTENILPAAWRGIQDYKTAVRFLRKTVAEDGNPYGIESDRIIGSGFGAGGYLPVNAMAIDVPSEIEISPELMKKNFFGNPTDEPYIDTTIQNLDGVAYTTGPHSQYSFQIGMIGNYSGAVPTLKVFNQGTFPPMISVHSTDDEATPYETNVVFALGLFPVIEVSGSHDIHERLENDGQNQLFKDEARDGYTQKRIAADTDAENMYKNGLLTFPGEVYMWSGDGDSYNQNYDPTYKAWMDSVVTYSAARFQKWIGNTSSIADVEASKSVFSIYPNPASSSLKFTTENTAAIEKVEVLDMGGRTLAFQKVINGVTTIDVSKIATGSYYIKAISKDKAYIQRFIKE